VSYGEAEMYLVVGLAVILGLIAVRAASARETCQAAAEKDSR
jgi:hypothetical protein